MADTITKSPAPTSIGVSQDVNVKNSRIATAATKLVLSAEARAECTTPTGAIHTWKGQDYGCPFSVVYTTHINKGGQSSSELEIESTGVQFGLDPTAFHVVIQNGRVTDILISKLKESDIAELETFASGLEARLIKQSDGAASELLRKEGTP